MSQQSSADGNPPNDQGLPTMDEVRDPRARMAGIGRIEARVDPSRPSAPLVPKAGREIAFREAFRGLAHMRAVTRLKLEELEKELAKQLIAAGIAEVAT